MTRIFAMALTVIVALCLASCSCAESKNVETPIEGSRFVEVERNHDLYFCVVYDKETMVMYTVSIGSYNFGNVTPLLDSTSRPLTYKRNK